MDWNACFHRTLRDYGISAVWLSEKSGISKTTISLFRTGKRPMTTDNLDVLLACMPLEAREYFFSLLLGSELPPAVCPKIEEQIEKLSKESKKELVMTIVESLAQSSREERSSRQKVELVK